MANGTVKNARTLGALLFVTVPALATSGCWVPPTGLPSSVSLELPDGTTVQAKQGSGASSLANSRWQVFQVGASAQAVPYAMLRFGPQGNLVGFDENVAVSEIFGPTIHIDGRRHTTRQNGLQYAAAAYGAETRDGSGIAIQGRIVGFVAGFQGANATASATATFDSADPNTMRGTFSLSTRVTLISLPLADLDESFAFLARRVSE